ncbi:AI-2E family transporter [Nocardioidaceae bacterium]|nr:AI-2E family transporter [Nocardioidaceae bacterium]
MPNRPEDQAEHATREERIGRGLATSARWTAHLLVLAVGFVALGLLVSVTWSILLPVLLAILLCTVLHPLTAWLHARGLPHAAAAGIGILTALLVVAGFVGVIAPTVAPQVADLAESSSRGLDDVRSYLRDGPLSISDDQLSSVVTQAQDRLSASADQIANGLLVTAGAVVGFLINLVLTLVLAFLFLKDGHRFLPWVDRLAGRTGGAHLTELLRRIWVTISGFIRAQALVGLLDAILIGVGLLIVGVPLALPLAVLTFVAAFAPIIGAVTVGALAVLVALVSNGVVAAIIVFVIVLVVQQLEGNVFLPWLQGRSLGLHAGVVLLAIVLGSTLFGVIGAFLSVPVAATAAVVLGYLSELADGRRPESEPAAATAADEETAEE